MWGLGYIPRSSPWRPRRTSQGVGEEVTTEVEETTESGKEFRAKYEALMASERALRESFASTFKYVSADDLKDLAPDQLKSKAQEIEASRKAEREALAKEFLAERGVPSEQLETVLSSLAAGTPPATQTTEDESAAARIASLGQLGGTAHTGFGDTTAFGESRIDAALAAE